MQSTCKTANGICLPSSVAATILCCFGKLITLTSPLAMATSKIGLPSTPWIQLAPSSICAPKTEQEQGRKQTQSNYINIWILHKTTIIQGHHRAPLTDDDSAAQASHLLFAHFDRNYPATDATACLQNLEVGQSVLDQMIGGRKTGHSRSDNQHFAFVLFARRRWRRRLRIGRALLVAHSRLPDDGDEAKRSGIHRPEGGGGAQVGEGRRKGSRDFRPHTEIIIVQSVWFCQCWLFSVCFFFFFMQNSYVRKRE